MNRTSRVGALLAASLAVASLGTASTRSAEHLSVQARALVGDAAPAARSAEKSSPSRGGERSRIAKAMLGLGYASARRRRYPNGPGWTHAHVQRMAKKRRGRARNKSAHR